MSSRIVPAGIDLASLRERLNGFEHAPDRLRRFGIGPSDKGKWGKANELRAGLSLSPSPDPDLTDGELKTTVRGTDGRFRESVKICMTGHSPMRKLEHIYLVIARDQNDCSSFARRVVRNEQVISLRPRGHTLRALEFDELLLTDHPKATETHFLETRTAGSRDSSTRAFYIRATALERYIADTVVVDELKLVRRRLAGVCISPRTLEQAGISASQKSAVGRFILKTVDSPELYATVRQGRSTKTETRAKTSSSAMRPRIPSRHFGR